VSPPARPTPSTPGARAGRVGLIAAAVALGLVALSSAINALVPSRHGPPSSSYATTPAGLAAYAELLARTGHPVAQLRRPPAPGVLSPAATVILLDPDAVLPAEGRALAAFLAAGGHLVTGGTSSGSFLATILPRPPGLSASAPPDAVPLAAVPETAGVGRVVTLGQAGWSPGRARPGLLAALGRARRPPLLMVGNVGRGRIDLLADASPLQNRLLARADDARLAVDLAGADRRPVVFVESVHGYGPARGLAALPGRWWWALGGLTLAGLAWVAARWPRLGPPSVRGRTLPPARSAYLQAMTTILRRTDAPAEVAGLARAAARRLAARRLGPTAPGIDEYRTLGLDEVEARALAASEPPGADDLLTLGAALARLERRG
jgi:hypothetical protein